MSRPPRRQRLRYVSMQSLYWQSVTGSQTSCGACCFVVSWTFTKHRLACHGAFMWSCFYVLHAGSRIFACVFTYCTTLRGFLHTLRALFIHLVKPCISCTFRRNPNTVGFSSGRNVALSARAGCIREYAYSAPAGRIRGCRYPAPYCSGRVVVLVALWVEVHGRRCFV